MKFLKQFKRFFQSRSRRSRSENLAVHHARVKLGRI